MAKPEWGTKCICQECGARFYDMRRAEIICPKCGVEYHEAPPKPKRAPPELRKQEDVKPSVAPAVATNDEQESKDKDGGEDADALGEIDIGVEEADIEDDDEDVIEDTSDLGDDDDDVAEVVQKPETTDEA